MIRFGHSAFLKIANLNPRPQRTEIQKRLAPSKGGFDFHKSLRLRSADLALREKTVGEIVASVAEIKQLPERRSTTAGLKQLIAWLRRHDGLTYRPTDRTFQSPNKVFSVKFDPVFGIEIEGKRIAVHLWNTAKPVLDARMVYSTLSLFSKHGDDEGDELALLSLRDGRLYRTDDLRSDTPSRDLFIYYYENLIAASEGRGTPIPPPEDRPRL